MTASHPETHLDERESSLWAKAKIALETKNFPYAISLLKPLVKAHPEFLEARQQLRRSAIQVVGGKKKKAGLFGGFKPSSNTKKDPTALLSDLEDDLEKDPYSENLNEQLYQAALRLNLLDLAAFALETVRASKPDGTRLLHLLAEHYTSRNLPDKAIEVYRDILKINPTDGAAVKGEKDASARSSMKKQNWENATGMSGLIRNSEEQKEQENRNRTGMTPEQIEERLAGLYERYHANNQDLSVCKEIASLLEQKEDWASARGFYEWAYSLSTGDVTLQNKAMMMAQNERRQYIRDLEAGLEQDPNNEELRQQLEAYRAQTAADQVEECRRRVAQNPTDPQLRFDLGSALFHSGNASEAIPELQRARNNPHLRTRAMLLLGRSYEQKNMYDLAVKTLGEALQELISMDGMKKDLLYTQGVILEKMGQKVEALERFKLIYDADYGYRDVAKRVESSYGE